MTYTPLNSGQCDPNKIKQLSFQIVIYKDYNNFQIVIGNSKCMIALKPEKISGFSGRNLAVSKLQVKSLYWSTVTKIFKDEIEPKGFDVVKMDGNLTGEVVTDIKNITIQDVTSHDTSCGVLDFSTTDSYVLPVLPIREKGEYHEQPGTGKCQADRSFGLGGYGKGTHSDYGSPGGQRRGEPRRHGGRAPVDGAGRVFHEQPVGRYSEPGGRGIERQDDDFRNPGKFAPAFFGR
jgi:hypothetical protein